MHAPRRGRSRIAALLGVAALGQAVAAEPTPDLLRAWTALNHASLRVTTADNGDYQQLDFDVTPQHDVRVNVEDMMQGHGTRGTLMVISDRALLVKDLPLDAGAEIDAIDSPALVLQIVEKLLAASGKTPGEIRGKLALDRHEDWDLSVATASAEAEYPAPWTVRGSLEAKPDGAIAFDLVHAFRTEDTPVEIHYRGRWQKSAVAPALDEAMPLAGWQVFSFGPMQRSDGHGGTNYDFGARPIAPVPATLRELRRMITAQPTEKPGASLPSPSPR